MKTKEKKSRFKHLKSICGIIFISYLVYHFIGTKLLFKLIGMFISNNNYIYNSYQYEINLLLFVFWMAVTFFIVHLYYVWQISFLHNILLNEKIKHNRYILPEIVKLEKQYAHVQNQFMAMQEEYKEQQVQKHDMIIYLAHDLKTPLTSVIGYFYLLKDKLVRQRRDDMEYLPIIEEKLQRLELLRSDLQQTLTIGEKSYLQLSNVDIVSSIRNSLRDLNVQKDMRDIQLTGEDSIMIKGDQQLLQRLFENLIRNAFSYGESNGILHVHCCKKEQNVDIQIQNTALGLKEEQLPLLFRKFYRQDESRVSNNGGAGLGLAIAKDIVEQHHGNIQATLENHILSMHISLPRKEGGDVHV